MYAFLRRKEDESSFFANRMKSNILGMEENMERLLERVSIY